MGFNTAPNSGNGRDLVSTAIVNQIHVNGVNTKALPTGYAPSVVYRVGDGTVNPEGWNNVVGEEYLDFYLPYGASGSSVSTGGGQYLGTGNQAKGVSYMNQVSSPNDAMRVEAWMNAFSIDSFTVEDGSEIVIEDGAVYKVL